MSLILYKLSNPMKVKQRLNTDSKNEKLIIFTNILVLLKGRSISFRCSQRKSKTSLYTSSSVIFFASRSNLSNLHVDNRRQVYISMIESTNV